MSNIIHVAGVPQALAAFRELPRRVGIKHLRIGLNAAGGLIRDRARALAPKESGLLKRSLAVKVKIPAASYNSAHHSKPAYAIIGPKRNFVRAVAKTSKGFRTKGAAGIAKAHLSGKTVTLRRPSRYAHLAEKHQSFINAAERQVASAAVSKMAAKLKAGFAQESAALAKG